MYRQGCVAEPVIIFFFFSLVIFDGQSFVITVLPHNSVCVRSECGLTEQSYFSFHSLYWKEQYCTKAGQRWVSKNNDIFPNQFCLCMYQCLPSVRQLSPVKMCNYKWAWKSWWVFFFFRLHVHLHAKLPAFCLYCIS